MKNIKLILTGIFFFFLSFGIMAQGGNPPDPPGDHGDDEDQPAGGGAPIGTATFLLIGLAGAYGAKKVFWLKKSEE